MSGEALTRLLYVVREYLPLIIFLVVFPITIYAGYRSRRANASKLKELAAKLGLKVQEALQPEVLDQAYRQGMAAYRGSDRMKAEQAYRRIEQSGFLKSLFSLAQPMSISGKYNGYQVEIKLIHQNKKNFTEASAQFGKPLGIGLRMAKTGFWSRSISLAKHSLVESGNPELDKAVSVSANDELRAKYIVRNFQTQQALLALFAHKGAELTDQGACIRADGYQTDYIKVKKLLDDMIRALQAVSASLGQDDIRKE